MTNETPDPCSAGAPPRPAAVASAAEAAGRGAFTLAADLVEAQFHRRAPVLFVTFDNLGSVGEYDPPQPWLHVPVAKAGFSILGLIARRKDWYRNADTPQLITALRDAGLFSGFERVIFTGTSMGGYAALTYARLVPAAEVLAFSPQTTLNRQIAPFEQRFKYGLRKWDWESPAFLDAAEAVPGLGQILLFYDPFIPEDRAHAARLHGPHVQHIKCRHFGHKLIRQIKGCGALQELVASVGAGRFDATAFHKSLRPRRTVRPWCRELLTNALKNHHLRLAEAALDHLETEMPGARTLSTVRAALDRRRAAPLAEPVTLADGDPQPPFTGTVLRAGYATVVPERAHDAKLASGVLLADGRYCEMSRTWVRATKATAAPVLSRNEPVDTLEGTHLFAGHLRGHFDHFLVESTARLWALEALQAEVDSLLFLPFRGAMGKARRARRSFKGLLEQLSQSLPVRLIDRPTEVERLYIPELGFGWGDRYAGSPLYRQLMRSRLGRDIAAEGPDRLYISRAQLPAQRGGILGEQIIEENLARAGYHIFHPEKHTLAMQIARYKAARQIVALDGSALHFAAFLLPARSRLCIVLRRTKANVDDYIRQYQTFCEITPDVVDVIRTNWVLSPVRRSDFRSVGELDFAALFDALKTQGYLDARFQPRLPSAADLHPMVQDLAEQHGATLTRLDQDS